MCVYIAQVWSVCGRPWVICVYECVVGRRLLFSGLLGCWIRALGWHTTLGTSESESVSDFLLHKHCSFTLFSFANTTCICILFLLHFNIKGVRQTESRCLKVLALIYKSCDISLCVSAGIHSAIQGAPH